MDEQELHLRDRFKQELRRRMRAIRKALPVAARARRSARIAQNASAIDRLMRARCVAGFVAIKGEVDPERILDLLRQQGARVCLPRVDRQEQAIVLHEHLGETLQIGGFGVPEPQPDAPRIALDEIDLVLVPGLAFDPRGHRIGYGKGYYDQLLPTLPNALRVAVGYDFQLVSEVPDLAHDVPVDFIVTDARVLEVATGDELR